MALLTCEDCGGKVSDKAAACPHCGCPTPQSVGSATPTVEATAEPPPSTGTDIPDAWKPAAVEASAVTPDAPKPIGLEWKATSIVVCLVLLVLFIQWGVSFSSSPRGTAVADEVIPAASSTPPVVEEPWRPTEVELGLWVSAMDNKEALPTQRLEAANNLIEHFADRPEGQRAVEQKPVLEETVAYELKGKQWRYDHQPEGMSDKLIFHATVASTNVINLSFPYQGPQHGTLRIRKHPRWGNDIILTIERGQILCHSYSNCPINVRFDDGKVRRYDGNPPSDNSSETVFIPAYTNFMRELPKASTVRIEVPIYQAGNKVFEFDVSGFKSEKLAP